MYSVYTLLKVVGYYDLSVLSSDGFQKKKNLDGGFVSSIQFFWDFWNFLLCKAL